MILDWTTFNYRAIRTEARHRFEQAKNSEAEDVTDEMRTLGYWTAWVAHANAVAAVADDSELKREADAHDARAAAGTAAIADFLEVLRKSGEADLVSTVLRDSWREVAAADAGRRS